MKLKVLNVDKEFIRDPETLRDRLVWNVKYEVSDRQQGEHPIFYHKFPDEQISFVMAAYGIDDVAEAVDMILADPFHEKDPGPALLSAASTEEARAVHRDRCARVKLRTKLSSRGITNPLEMIRGSYTPSPELLARGENALHNARREYRRMNRG